MTKEQQIKMSEQLLNDMMNNLLNAKTQEEKEAIEKGIEMIQESIKNLSK